MREIARTQLGIVLVVAGLALQLGAGLFWGPGTFVLSAVAGVPLVGVGAIVAWLGIRQARRRDGQS